MDRLQVKIEIDRLNQEIEELKAENARYREALEFYADKKKWSFEYDEYNRGFSRWCIMYGDLEEINEHVGYGGRRAREALKGGE